MFKNLKILPPCGLSHYVLKFKREISLIKSILLIMLLDNKKHGDEDAHYPFIDAGPTSNLRAWKIPSAITTAVPWTATWGWL